MSKVIKYISLGLLALALILPRGWCCLVPQENPQLPSKSATKADICPFCNHQESSDKDSDSKPINSSHPYPGFCCCEKMYGSLLEKSISLDDPTGVFHYLTIRPIFIKSHSNSGLVQSSHFAYPNHQRTHVLNCQWLC